MQVKNKTTVSIDGCIGNIPSELICDMNLQENNKRNVHNYESNNKMGNFSMQFCSKIIDSKNTLRIVSYLEFVFTLKL